MIRRYINSIIERWLFAIARAFLQEAKEAENYDETERRIFIGIASALNRADVKIFK